MVELSTRPPFLNIIIILILSLRRGGGGFGAQFWVIFLKLSLHKMAIGPQRARTDLNKRFLPKPMTTTG